MKDRYLNKIIRNRRADGLTELVQCYMDIDEILRKRDNLNWYQKRYFNRLGKIVVKNYDSYQWLRPDIQLEVYNCVYENTLAKFPKLKTKHDYRNI